MNRQTKRKQIKNNKSREYKKHNAGAFGGLKFFKKYCLHKNKFNIGTIKKPVLKCKLCESIIKE